jgi:hypothetical protein
LNAAHDAQARERLATALEQRGLGERASAVRRFTPAPLICPAPLRLEPRKDDPCSLAPGFKRYATPLRPRFAVVGDFLGDERTPYLEDRRLRDLRSIDGAIADAAIALPGRAQRARSLADLEHAAPAVRASWHAVAWLLREARGVELDLFTADAAELAADFENAASLRRTAFHNWLRPYNHPGMEPFFGAVVLTELNPVRDQRLLASFARVANELSLPVVLSLEETPLTALGEDWEQLRAAAGARHLMVGATPFSVSGQRVSSGLALGAAMANAFCGEATVNNVLSPVRVMGYRPAPFSELAEARARGVSLFGSTSESPVAVTLASAAPVVPLSWSLAWSRLRVLLDRLHLECAGIELGAREPETLVERMQRAISARLGDVDVKVELLQARWLRGPPEEPLLRFGDALDLELKLELPLAEGGYACVQDRVTVGRPFA